jgi:hypothetical protein
VLSDHLYYYDNKAVRAALQIALCVCCVSSTVNRVAPTGRHRPRALQAYEKNRNAPTGRVVLASYYCSKSEDSATFEFIVNAYPKVRGSQPASRGFAAALCGRSFVGEVSRCRGWKVAALGRAAATG